ncbi:MAG: methylated-DNA--[protein]-cysteine S-methyltransferase [Syntrophobacteraceae bacterium]
MEYFSAQYESPVGRIMLGANDKGLVGLWIEGQKYFGDTVDGEFVEKPDLPIFAAVRKWLDAYFAGEKPPISDLALAPIGGEFRKAVWDILCEIPYGQYTTYGKIAKKMALRMNKKSMSSQAVGGAVGHNPISIIIPCHRVVGSNGSLTGYAGGIRKKIQLLEIEGVDTSNFFIPGKGTAL